MGNRNIKVLKRDGEIEKLKQTEAYEPSLIGNRSGDEAMLENGATGLTQSTSYNDDDLEIQLIENALDQIEDIEEMELGDCVHLNKRSLKESDLADSLETNLKLFLNQNIDDIRKEEKRFVDPHFKASIEVITDNVSSDLAQCLSSSLRVTNKFDLNELNSKILWKKSKIIAYSKRSGKNEFVLDALGNALPSNASAHEYAKYFTVDDIFQGLLGDCFMIAAIMGITQNKRLISFLMPIDNASRANMKIGAYHFRLWKLGEWYDVVVDDYLATDYRFNLIFTRNLTFVNEFWIALLEKSVAK